MAAFIENIVIMILTIVVLLGCGYLLLVIVGWGLEIKSGRREQEGLTELWIASQTKTPEPATPNEETRNVNEDNAS